MCLYAAMSCKVFRKTILVNVLCPKLQNGWNFPLEALFCPTIDKKLAMLSIVLFLFAEFVINKKPTTTPVPTTTTRTTTRKTPPPRKRTTTTKAPTSPRKTTQPTTSPPTTKSQTRKPTTRKPPATTLPPTVQTTWAAPVPTTATGRPTGAPAYPTFMSTVRTNIKATDRTGPTMTRGKAASVRPDKLFFCALILIYIFT